MKRKIIGVTVGSPLPKSNLRQTDHTKGDYVYGKDVIPQKVSDLENDAGYLVEHQDISGKLDADKLPEAVNTALAQAKASGEFDGKDGQDGYTPQKGIDYFDGVDGKDGYTPVKGVDYFDGKDGKDGYTPVKGVDYFDGVDGQPGKNGVDGVSASHEWNGTVLTITSANGTSSADLKGDPGKDGSPGKDGAAGYTPVKGKDYYTDADKAEMVDAVLAALPVWEGGSY